MDLATDPTPPGFLARSTILRLRCDKSLPFSLSVGVAGSAYFYEARFLQLTRVLTVCLTLAALVFSNVAGWVHVGCASQWSACCSDSCDDSDGSPAKKTVPDRSCCRHHGGASCQTQATEPLDEKPADPQQSDSQQSDSQQSDPHDSDRCSICQNFFTSRHAVPAAVVEVASAPMVVCQTAVVVDKVFAPNSLLRSDTVRGPPRV